MERNCKSIKLFGVEITTTSTAPAIICREDIMGRKMKKGNRWTKDEQRAFLKGLDFHGKGNWVKIAKDFLPSRTSTQVASHAQKYFVRLLDAYSNSNERKKCKKSSVFDLHLEKTEDTDLMGNNEESHNRVVFPVTWVYMYPYQHHYDASTSSASATTFDKPRSGISSSSSSSMDNNLELTL